MQRFTSSDYGASPGVGEDYPTFGVVLHFKFNMGESGGVEIVFETTLGKEAHFKGESGTFMKHKVVKGFDCSVTPPVQQAPGFTFIDQLPVMEFREVFASITERGAKSVIPHHVIEPLNFSIGLTIDHEPTVTLAIELPVIEVWKCLLRVAVPDPRHGEQQDA